jgi:hypothetical protein
MHLSRCVLLMAILLLSLPACQRSPRTDEGLPFANRQILAERVSWARDAQRAAAEEFRTALDRVQAVVAQGGEPEEQYRILWHTNERSRDWAENVRSHIDTVEQVGRGLFNQWHLELGHYRSERLRMDSKRYLDEVHREYQQMLTAMRKAEDELMPLQSGINDQVLFLKHGLDPQRRELQLLQSDVANYLRAMEASVAEADAFLTRLEHP